MHTTQSNTQYKNESKHSEMGPVRQNPIQSRDVPDCKFYYPAGTGTELVFTYKFQLNLRLKARRRSNCLVASDTFISFRKTVTSSSSKLTILCKRWEHRHSHPCVTISAKATTTRRQRRIRFPASSAIDCAALTEYNAVCVCWVKFH